MSATGRAPRAVVYNRAGDEAHPRVTSPNRHPQDRVAAVIALASAVQGMLAVCTAALPALAPAIARTLGVDASLIGLQASLVYGSALAATFATGTLIRRLGATRTVQVALGLNAAGLCAAATGTLWTVAAGSVAIGLGLGITTPATAHWLARFVPMTRQNVVFSLKQAGVPLGGMAASLAGPAIAVTAGWPWALLFYAAVCLALLVALQPRRERWDDDRVPDAPWLGQPLGGIPIAWADPAVRSLVIAGALFNVMHVALTAFTVNLLVKDAGYALVVAGVVSGMAQFGGAAGRVMLGFAADRMRDSLTILWVAGALMTLMCLLTGTVGAHWPPSAVAVLFLVFGFIGIGWNGVFHGQLARLSPHGSVGMVSSGAGFFLFLTALAGPSLFAALYAALGSYTSTFAVLAVAPLAGLAFARRAQLVARTRGPSPRHPMPRAPR